MAGEQKTYGKRIFRDEKWDKDLYDPYCKTYDRAYAERRRTWLMQTTHQEAVISFCTDDLYDKLVFERESEPPRHMQMPRAILTPTQTEPVNKQQHDFGKKKLTWGKKPKDYHNLY